MFSRKPEINTLKGEVPWFPLDNREARRKRSVLKRELVPGEVAERVKKLGPNPDILSLIPRTRRVGGETVSHRLRLAFIRVPRHMWYSSHKQQVNKKMSPACG